MNNVQFSKFWFELRSYLRSSDFTRALILGIAIVIPVVTGIYYEYLEIGLSIALGALWTSPSNTNGSIRKNTISILAATALITCISLIGGYLDLTLWFLLPVLGFISFSVSFLAVYGPRAALVGFSGLMALVLSFAFSPQKLEVYEYSLLIGLGGIWYLLLAITWQLLRPKSQVEEVLQNIIEATAEFLEVRSQLIDPKEKHHHFRSLLIRKQDRIVELHQSLREILLDQKNINQSHYHGVRLLVFAQLVEILETALANPIGYDRMVLFFENNPKHGKSFSQLILQMANELRKIGNIPVLTSHTETTEAILGQTKNLINEMKVQTDKRIDEDYLMLKNFYEYQEELLKRLNNIKDLLTKKQVNRQKFLDNEFALKFAPQQNYSISVWKDNFNFKSPIFKHSLRLSIAMILGFLLGSVLEFQNQYWILLTIMVIMRPSYGLTKSRTKERIIGTLIGAVIAMIIVTFWSNFYLYGVLGVVTLVLAFSVIQKNHMAGAIFVTLSIIFIYGILQPDIFEVISYRIYDTLLGGALSFIAIKWICPNWSYSQIEQKISDSLDANRNYFKQIVDYYTKKGAMPADYQIARKQAFDKNSNLSNSFQEIVQEPVSKQGDFTKTYEMVVLNFRLLSSLSTLNGFIRSHSTTEASPDFLAIAHHVETNLLQAIAVLGNKHIENPSKTNDAFKEKIGRLKHQTLSESQANTAEEGLYQEAHLILEQIQWLQTISQSMLFLVADWKNRS